VDEQQSAARELDEALDRIKSKIDGSAESLKSRIGGTVHQIESVIDSADHLLGSLIERVNTTATQTRDVMHSAEKVAEHLEDPVGWVRKFPMAALTGALVGGLVLGLLVRQERKGFFSRREGRLKIAP